MDDLHSSGLRIDLAYLLGVAVFDADHVYLLSQNEKEKAGTFIHRRYCLMNARAGLNSNGSARLERYLGEAGSSVGNPAYALASAVFIT